MQKQKIVSILIIIMIIAIVIPQITLAAWWNPFSWGFWNSIFHRQIPATQHNQNNQTSITDKFLRNATLLYLNPYDTSKTDTFTLINGKSALLYDAGNINPRGYNVAATAVGDLDADGVAEGAIGIYQGWGANRITPIFFVVSDKNNSFKQIDYVLPDPSVWNNETAIKSLSIDKGILTVNILILSEADKQLPHYQQQASVPKTVQYKLINGKLVLQKGDQTTYLLPKNYGECKNAVLQIDKKFIGPLCEYHIPIDKSAYIDCVNMGGKKIPEACLASPGVTSPGVTSPDVPPPSGCTLAECLLSYIAPGFTLPKDYNTCNEMPEGSYGSVQIGGGRDSSGVFCEIYIPKPGKYNMTTMTNIYNACINRGGEVSYDTCFLKIYK